MDARFKTSIMKADTARFIFSALTVAMVAMFVLLAATGGTAWALISTACFASWFAFIASTQDA